MSEKFIFTKDRHVAEQLRRAGFTEIPTATNFLFLNDTEQGRVVFENIEMEKIVLTSNICI